MPKHLRTLPLVLAIALVAVLAAVPPARADMAQPAWTPGDYWEYNVVAFMGFTGTGKMWMNVSGTETIRIDGVDYSSYHLDVTVKFRVITGPLTAFVNVTGTAWYRTSDLASIKEDVSGTYEAAGTGSFVVSALIYWSPPQEIRWPLVTGTTWTAAGWANSTVTFGIFPPVVTNVTYLTIFRVQTEQTVTVPAGTFLTTPLNATDLSGGYNVSYWSPDAGNLVLQRGFDGLGAETQHIELASYRYQAGSDTRPPSITGVNVNPPAPRAGASVTIGATVTDDVMVDTVSVNVTTPGGSTVNATMAKGAGNRYTYAQTWSEVGVHTFVIWASDTARKWASAADYFEVLPQDTTAPTIQHTPPAGPLYTDSTIRIAATVTDDDAVQEVRVNYTDVSGSPHNVTMTLAGTEYVYTIPAQGAAGTVRYRIYAVDPSGNGNTTQEYALTIENRPVTTPIDFVLVGAIVIIVVVAAAIAAAVLLRRRKKKEEPPEETLPPE